MQPYHQPAPPPFVPPPPRRRRLHPMVILGPFLAVAVLAAAAVAYSATRPPRTVTIRGAVTITSNIAGGESCQGERGYGDMRAGAAVVVHDPGGKVVAAGELGEGVGSNLATSQIALSCRFPFVVKGAPEERFYGIEVSHRGVVTFTAAQVRAGEVELSLGS